MSANYWVGVTINEQNIEEALEVWERGDLKVKYLDDTDFAMIGYRCRKIFIKKQEVIIDIYPDGTEITEMQDVYEEETLQIFKGAVYVGEFYPFKPEKNVKVMYKDYTVKNLTELRKVLK